MKPSKPQPEPPAPSPPIRTVTKFQARRAAAPDKPFYIEAIQWDGTNWNAIAEFLPAPENGHRDEPMHNSLRVRTSKGTGFARAYEGDIIVKNSTGLYVVKPPTFHSHYEPAE